MPLLKKCSVEAYEANVKQLIKDGYPPKQAVAIAHETLRQACRDEHMPTPSTRKDTDKKDN
mgnify:CR=1 FL=1